MEQLRELVKIGKEKETAERVQTLLANGQEPDMVMKDGLIQAMDEVGDLFQKNG